MPIRRQLQKSCRVLATLVLLCYVWVSAVLPFQHVDNLDDAEGSPASFSFIHTGPRLPMRTCLRSDRRAAAQKASHAGPCLACQWQANNVSAALPIFSFTSIEIYSKLSVVTILPRYLRSVARTPSSRGPPLV